MVECFFSFVNNGKRDHILVVIYIALKTAFNPEKRLHARNKVHYKAT